MIYLALALVMYAAVFGCLTLGRWLGYREGREDGYEAGIVDGYNDGVRGRFFKAGLWPSFEIRQPGAPETLRERRNRLIAEGKLDG